jgi:hypothetical protein
MQTRSSTRQATAARNAREIEQNKAACRQFLAWVVCKFGDDYGVPVCCHYLLFSLAYAAREPMCPSQYRRHVRRARAVINATWYRLTWSVKHVADYFHQQRTRCRGTGFTLVLSDFHRPVFRGRTAAEYETSLVGVFEAIKLAVDEHLARHAAGSGSQ